MDFETPPYTVQAEACFQGAIMLARRQGALLWELRASRSLSRLQIREGRAREACDQLEAVYGKFGEGLETEDLRQAKTLIDALRSGSTETLQALSRRRNFPGSPGAAHGDHRAAGEGPIAERARR